MRGRPPRSTPEDLVSEVQGLADRGWGARRIAKRLGLSRWQVRRLLPSASRSWTDAERDHLRSHAGECGPERLARELTRMGTRRTADAVRRELLRLGLTLAELRTDLTVSLVCELTGRSEPYVLRAIGRRELAAERLGVSWRIWPSQLRSWILADKARVLWKQVELREELVGLLAGEWGREARKKARGREEVEA